MRNSTVIQLVFYLLNLDFKTGSVGKFCKLCHYKHKKFKICVFDREHRVKLEKKIDSQKGSASDIRTERKVFKEENRKRGTEERKKWEQVREKIST